jgi:proline dehydrogenase
MVAPSFFGMMGMGDDSAVSFEDTSVAFSYKSDGALKKANSIFSMVNHPWISSLAIGSVKLALSLRLPVEGIIKRTAFDHFCGGVSIDSCDDDIAILSKYGVGTILDYSVEGEDSDAGFDQTMQETLRTIEKAATNPAAIPFSVFKPSGVASSDLLEKVQRGDVLTPEEQQGFQRVRQRFETICARAFGAGIPVLIDAEHSWTQDPVDALAYEMMAKFNGQRAIVFNTYQLYRTAALPNLKRALEEGKERGFRLGAKLVRGAYMEIERERAAEKGYPDPIQPDKEACDRAFDEGLEFCIDNIDRLDLVCGSHNERSNLHLASLMKRRGLSNADARVWFAQLYGMSDNISFNLAKAGYRVAKYMPYGPVRSVMPYLFRRAEENTSVAGQSSRELVLIRKELQRRKQQSKNGAPSHRS